MLEERKNKSEREKNMFKTIKENVSAEIVEKKSKFIANIFYVETREEAESIIKDINKKYHDMRISYILILYLWFLIIYLKICPSYDS